MTDTSLNCPRCTSAMEIATHADVDVNRCTECRGLFCDSEAYIALLTTDGTEELDSRGSILPTEQETMSCPRCEEKMVTYRYEPQPHIKLDRCANCFGVFFDAGELTDMKKNTLLDWFRDLLHR